MRVAILAIVASLCLSSCSDFLNQQIVRARVNAPSAPPLPILPLDDPQRVVLEGAASERLGPLPTGRLLGDSASSRLDLNSDPLTGGGLFILHYQVIWAGLELSSHQYSLLFGGNISQEDWKLLAYFGIGEATYHQDLLLQSDQLGNPGVRETLVHWTGSTTRFNSTLGLSAMSSLGRVQPFAALRILEGPNVDGTETNELPADNSFSLGQLVVDAGARIDAKPDLHFLAGLGWRTFTGGAIRGGDARVFMGFILDIGRFEDQRSPPDPVRSKSNVW